MISKRLKETREQHGLNKKEMAQKLDVPYTTYNNYETGQREPGHSFLIKVSKTFNITIDYLMGNNCANTETLLLGLARGLSNEDIKKVIEYAELLKKAHS